MALTEEARRKRNAYMRQYRSRNKEKVNEIQRKWRAENPDKVRQHNENYWNKKVAEMERGGRLASSS